MIGEEPGEARVVGLGEEKVERLHLHRRCPVPSSLWLPYPVLAQARLLVEST